MTYRELIDVLVEAIEILGTAVIVVGGLIGGVRAAVGLVRGTDLVYTRLRRELGHAVLLGLEILVAADIILTVAVEPTLDSLLALGLLVLIRTFLSFSIETEIEGRPPWRAHRARSRTAEPTGSPV
ncbi:DUF1622 domain-containing protein [Pseudonocardia bannensis]|uniref:DUF1622 domain-containing protein n=1 Tax=Pseudonocardia bannensis TaxID=630973 RepID=A0A848DLI4_9PSEU|nr:DUF1622 domain-containing protein [Pseudonocardia bannensis]NMH93403.1 DUF1622 domain-containing protein [Pseudonocardia bannensis]